MKCRWFGLSILFLLLLFGSTLWWFWPRGLSPDSAALAELNIDKLTCGSCAERVREAVGDMSGLGRLDISVTAGTGRIEFDPSRVNAEQVAETISDAGYPCRVKNTLSVDEYRALRQRRLDLGGKYIAEIGSRLLSRKEFAAMVAQRQKLQGGGPAPSSLRLTVWNQLLQRELLLNVAEANEVVVQDGEVALRLQQLRQGHPDFEKVVREQFGTLENLTRQLKTEMILDRTLTRKVLPPGLEGKARAEFLDRWYRKLVRDTPVHIFDPDLAALVEGGGSGCGGSCCDRPS